MDVVWTTYNIPSRHLEALPIFQILFLKTYISEKKQFLEAYLSQMLDLKLIQLSDL